MKTYLPPYFKQIGILLVFIAIVLSHIGHFDEHRQDYAKGFTESTNSAQGLYGESELKVPVLTPYFTKEESNIYIMISLFFSITGIFLYLFSKEKIDDEYIQQIRLKSILQAFLISWIVYPIGKYIITINPMDGIYILQMQLIVYVIIFRYHKNKAISEQEEEEEEIALKD